MEEKILKGKKVAELKEIARTFGIDGYDAMKKAELIDALMETENKGENPVETAAVNENRGTEQGDGQKNGQRSVVPDKADRTEMEGFLEVNQDGFGFLRFDNFETSDKDIYVSPVQIRRFSDPQSGLHLQPIGCHTVKGFQDSVKTGKNPQMLLNIVIFPVGKDTGSHILVLDTFIGQNGRRQMGVKIHVLQTTHIQIRN